MKKDLNKYPKIKQSFKKYEFTSQEIENISRQCFYDNKEEIEEIRKTFEALAKM